MNAKAKWNRQSNARIKSKKLRRTPPPPRSSTSTEVTALSPLMKVLLIFKQAIRVLIENN
jgi:hypothetical protein